MAVIDERTDSKGKTKYRVRIRMRDAGHQSKTFRNKHAAKAWARKVESEIYEGKNFPGTQLRKRRFSDLIDRYLLEVLPLKPKSIRKQTMQLNWWMQQIGHLRLSEVTQSMIAEKRNLLSRGHTSKGILRSPSTVNRYLAALSHVFSIAISDWEWWLADNPVSRISRPKEAPGRQRILSQAEMDILLEACAQSKNSWLLLIVKLAICTGMRKGEILGLRWSSISFDEKTITLLETKNREIRIIPLTETTESLLAAHRHTKRCDFVFPSMDNRRPADINEAWKNAVRRSGLKNFRFHDLRHVCASLLCDAGSSTLVIGSCLGHKTLAMVRHYSKNTEEGLRRELSRMNEKLFR